MKNSKYRIVFSSDDKHKQLQITKPLFLASVCFCLVLFFFIGASGFWLFNTRQGTAFDELQKENESLKLANDRYLEATLEMEKKLNSFESKTNKLAQYVGVESSASQSDGIGGPDLLDNELSEYLRYDLGLLERKTVLLEERLDLLAETFESHTELLDSTPSLLPARGWISSGFKKRTDPFTKKTTWHRGLDVSCPQGTPVYAPANGIVTYKGYQGGFGNLLVITHSKRLKTRYGHLARFNVSKGKRVKRGDIIAYVGNTGRSTAPHLHYEIHKDGKSLNPFRYIIREAKTF